MMDFSAPSRPNLLSSLKQLLNQPVLPARTQQPTLYAHALEQLSIPIWNTRVVQGYQLDAVLWQWAGSSGRYTRFAVEFHSFTGKPFTTELTRELPIHALVIGGKIQYMDPEKLKPRQGTILRLGKVEPDGTRYMVEAPPSAHLLDLALKGDAVSIQQYLRGLPWQKI